MLWVLLISCPSALAEMVLRPAELQRLLQQLDEVRQSHQTPAYSLIVTDARHTLLSEIRGNVSAESKSPVAGDRWFRIGSITKTFVALASMRAQEQQQLDLQEPVLQRLGAGYFKNPWVSQEPLRLVHLLEQTSGLADMSKAEWDSNTPQGLEPALRRFASQHRLSWPPGRYFSYSNTNYGLAGRVLEAAAGTPFADTLRRQVFAPLKMSKVAVRHSDNVGQLLVPGHDTDGRTRIPYWHMIYPPLGAISLAPSEMAPVLRMFLNRGAPLLRAESIARMETPQSFRAAQAGLSYGYGVGLYDWFHLGHRFYGHGGDGDGYLAHFGYQRESGLAYFLVINAFQKPALTQMRQLVETALVSGLPRPTPAHEFELSNPKAYTGEYYPVSWRFGAKPGPQRLKITQQGKQLMAELVTGENTPASTFALIAVSATQFRRRSEPAATMALVQTPEGWLFSGDEGNFLKPAASP